MPAMPPLLQQRWPILAGIPKVVTTENTKGGRRRVSCSISVAGDEFPCASVLTVPTRVSTAATNLWYPYVATADPSGMLLLCATQPLLCATAGKYDWVEKKLAYSSPLHRHFFGEGVVSRAGMLWWVDLSYGVLACDPFADTPELLQVPLPSVPDELPAASVHRGVYRCVKVSDGRLRHVEIHGGYDAPVVTVSALADPAAAGDWVPVRSVALADVWADQSYLNTSLPQSIPALALLHPTNPDKVYFFLRSSIFAVDLRLRKVVAFNDFWMPEPPPHLKRFSHFVHVWRNDPSDRPDILPSCFNRDKFSPDKKLLKRFAAAKSRATAMNPVEHKGSTTAVKPVAHTEISLKRTRDHEENIKMEAARREQLQAKKMKLNAVFSEVLENLRRRNCSPRRG